MAPKLRGKMLAAGLLAGALMGGGLAVTTPAGAAVKEAASAAINWKTIWKTEIKPRADKRYYTKKASNARYYTQAQVNAALLGYETKAAHDASLLGYYTKAQSDALLAAGLGNYYTKAQSDTNYYSKAQSDTNYYSKAASDAKYAPLPGLIRGVTMQATRAAGAGSEVGDAISFGVTLSAAPTVHYIPAGALPPAGCSGTAASPNAQAGHLCVFEVFSSNNTGNVIVTPAGAGGATAMGAVLFASSAAAGQVVITTTWAVRPIALAPPSAAIAGTLTSGGSGSFGR